MKVILGMGFSVLLVSSGIWIGWSGKTMVDGAVSRVPLIGWMK